MSQVRPNKVDKQKMQITSQIFRNLTEIVELYPQYTFAQHLASIQRRKSTDGKEFYFWSDEELLKNVEKHKLELETAKLEETEEDETEY